MKTFFFHICEQRRISTYSSAQSRFVGIFYSLNNSTSGPVYGPDQTVQKFKAVWESYVIIIMIIVIKLIVISSECFSAYSDCDCRKGFLYPTRP